MENKIIHNQTVNAHPINEVRIQNIIKDENEVTWGEFCIYDLEAGESKKKCDSSFHLNVEMADELIGGLNKFIDNCTRQERMCLGMKKAASKLSPKNLHVIHANRGYRLIRETGKRAIFIAYSFDIIMNRAMKLFKSGKADQIIVHDSEATVQYRITR